MGKDDCLQRFSLCWFSLPSRGPLLSGGLAQPYGFSFLLSVFFFFYLSGSQSWPPFKQDLEKTEGPRVEVQEDGPLRSYDCGASAPFLPPLDTGGGAQVFTDLKGPGVARAWVLSLSLLLAFRGGG